MTQKDFKAYSDARHESRERLSLEKGAAYAEADDRFGNFKRRAVSLCQTPMQVMLGDLSKHFDRVVRFARGVEQDTDGFESRIDDMIVYLQLIDGLHKEQQDERNTQTCARDCAIPGS